MQGEVSRVVVMDVAVRSYKFQRVAVYGPNCIWERCTFVWQLEPYLSSLERLILVGGLNVILSPILNRVEWDWLGAKAA